MPNYIPPHRVDSPQASVKNVRPIMDRGEGNWAAALLDWDGSPACALRWSGWARDDGEKPHPGTPQSRGLPTWFVLPEELALPVLEAIAALGPSGPHIDPAEAQEMISHAIAVFSTRTRHHAEGEERLRQIIREVIQEMHSNGEI